MRSHRKLTAAICLATIACSSVAASGERRDCRRSTAAILPPSAAAGESGHPLAAIISKYFGNSGPVGSTFKPSGLGGDDYLRIIHGQVTGFRKYQDPDGKIIDPVEKIEWQYSTPCYALSIGLLAATGYDTDAGLLASGVKAMDASVAAMAEHRCAHNHGEFYIQPVMLALGLYEPLVPAQTAALWKERLAGLDPYRLHPDNLRRKKICYNHNVVALAGEYLRAKRGLWPRPPAGGEDINIEFFDRHIEHHQQYMSPLGMYLDPKVPIVYDEFSRQFLASILAEGYSGPTFRFYRDKLWQGAWTSLFMQSPYGECPTGGRSAQHIWNEAECAVTYELYATQYARLARAAAEESPTTGAARDQQLSSEELLARAGAFKRAAHLSLGCIQRWLRPDGTGYVVKNRYPPEARHGYEGYSAQSQYNLLACWLMSVAYLYSDDSIAERPAPCDVGGYVLPIPDYHKVFACAGGTYVEYDTAGDLRYNPTGLIRVHLAGSNPQLGPSDGVVHKFHPKKKTDMGGENMCVGPAWRDAAGREHRLADYSANNTDTGPTVDPPAIDVLETAPARVRFRATFAGEMDGVTRVVETITVKRNGVTVEDALEGVAVKSLRVYYPAMAFDGLEETKLELQGNTLRMALRGGAAKFQILSPGGVELKRSQRRIDYRNGQVEPFFFDVDGTQARYAITTR